MEATKARSCPSRDEIARRVRIKAEAYGKEHDYPTSLRTLCAISSFALAETLRQNEYDAKIIWGRFNGRSHCWVVSGKKRWDITATQFGVRKKVYVSDETNVSYDKGKEIRTIHGLKKWPRRQKPYKKVIKALLR